MGRIVEGKWTCKSCGATEIGASKKLCPKCGAVQESYGLPPGATENIGKRVVDTSGLIYVDKDTERKAKESSADWRCPFCGRLNSSSNELCEGCESERSGKTYLDEKSSSTLLNCNEVRTSGGAHIHNKISEPIHKDESSPKNTRKTNRRSFDCDYYGRRAIKSTVGMAAMFAILTIAMLFVLFARFKHEETVSGFSWERTATIEEYKTVEESGWNLPEGARKVRESREIRTYEDVLDHYDYVEVQKSRQVVDYYEEIVTGYTDLGNGYYEENTSMQPVYKTEYYTETEQRPVYTSVPVYDTKYYYEVDKWVYKDTLVSKGNDKDPQNPDVTLSACDRIGNLGEKYKIHTFDGEGAEHSYEVSRQEWDAISKDEVLVFYTNIFGKIVSWECSFENVELQDGALTSMEAK